MHCATRDNTMLLSTGKHFVTLDLIVTLNPISDRKNRNFLSKTKRSSIFDLIFVLRKQDAPPDDCSRE